MKQAGSTLATMFTTSYAVPLVKAGQLRVGSVRLLDNDMACHDLSMLEAAFPGEAPILLGRDVLARGILECQFTRGRARVAAAVAREDMAGYARLELVRNQYGLPVVNAQIEDIKAQPAILDLGSNVACSVSEAYAEEVGLLSRPASTSMTSGLEGSTLCRQITVRSLRIADHILNDVPACIVPDWTLDAPVNLGWPAFAAFDLAFMFDRELHIRVDEGRLATPLPRDRSGIGAQRFSDYLLVRHVGRGSPAHEQGLIAGDRIVAIDGRPVDALHPARGKRLGSQPAGTGMLLTLEADRQIELVLKDYF
jgi:hypothetical protein